MSTVMALAAFGLALTMILRALTAVLGWLLGGRRGWLLRRTLEELDGLTGAEFEAWILAILQSEGIRARDTRATGDFGVDIIAEIGGRRIGIQAKKRRGRNIGNAAVQQANAGADYYGCDVAAVVTQSRFTRAARAQAERLARPCVLIGRDELPALAERLRRAVYEG